MKAIFNWAIAKGVYQITENPINKRGALGILLEPLTKQRTDTDNHPSLDFHEVPQFIEALTKLGSPSALAGQRSTLKIRCGISRKNTTR